MSKKHWEKFKTMVDNFYMIAEEKGFDLDHYNLKQVAELERKSYEAQVPPRKNVFRNTENSTTNKTKNKRTKNLGYIYLLRGNDSYKIGKSKEPDKRHKHLEVKLPFEVELLHTVKSDQYSKLESFLHNKFSNKRINGEWFDLNQEDVKYIKNLEGDEYA